MLQSVISHASSWNVLTRGERVVGTAQQFGSAHTEQKLQAVGKYLSAYTTALKKQSFELIYIDACAGSGSSTARRRADQPQLVEVDDITTGSAIRALENSVPFDRYIFNDAKRKNVRSLEANVNEHFPLLVDRVKIIHSDANEALVELCRKTDWKRTRAVVFLDPFGLQMTFSMVEELASTRAVDLWYLVPVLGMSRQIKNDGSVLPTGGIRIDDVLGTNSWREASSVSQAESADLFGPVEPAIRKVANAAWFERTAITQLGKVFRGGVLDEALPLGRGGLHEFSLVFACANPSPPANALAKKLAKAVLR